MLNKRNNYHVQNGYTKKCETEPKSVLNGEVFSPYFRNTFYCVISCYFDSFFFIQVYTYYCSFAHVKICEHLWFAKWLYALMPKKQTSDCLSDAVLFCSHEVAKMYLSLTYWKYCIKLMGSSRFQGIFLTSWLIFFFFFTGAFKICHYIIRLGKKSMKSLIFCLE